MDVFVMVFFSNSSLNFSCTGLMNGNRMERSKRGDFNQTCSKDSIARGVKTLCAMSSNVVTFLKCCNLQKPIHSSGQLG